MHVQETRGVPWLEFLLGVSILALVFQLCPGLWFGLLAALDVRNWTWKAWATLNALVIIILVAIRAWQNR